MNIIALCMALGGLVFVMTTVINYFRGIAEAKVTREIGGFATKLGLGIALALGSIGWAYQSGDLGALVLAPSILSTMVAGGVLWLLSQRKTPIGDLRVQVGDQLLAFEASKADGSRFHTEDLAGQRTLLKFFRGGW